MTARSTPSAPLFRFGVFTWFLLLGITWGAEIDQTADVVQLGPSISVNASKREAYLDATVCLRRGILEYIICKKNTFEHESVFSTEAKPSHLHLALLLIAAQPYPYSPSDDWPADVRKQPASLLDIQVEYTLEGVGHSRRLSQFLRNRERQDGQASDRWAFAGSQFYEYDGKEYYAADNTGGVIGLTLKGASVVQYADKSGVPYRGDNQGMECNVEAIPPAGTKARLIFRVTAVEAELAPSVAVPVAQEPAQSTSKP